MSAGISRSTACSTFDSVKLRLDREQSLSFLEFNYMILQAYDFVELNKRHGCRLQMGGSDQWGNIVNGIDLGHRMGTPQLYALTTPLLTTSSGAKMGKSAKGAVWLNADMLIPYEFWQYWRNTEDADVGRFLKLYTTPAAGRDRTAGRARRLGDQRGQEGAGDRNHGHPAWPRGGRAGRPRPRARPSRKARSPKRCRPSRSTAPSWRPASAFCRCSSPPALPLPTAKRAGTSRAAPCALNDQPVSDDRRIGDASGSESAAERRKAVSSARKSTFWCGQPEDRVFLILNFGYSSPVLEDPSGRCRAQSPIAD